MNLNFSISSAPSISNKLLCIIYKASPGNVEVAHQQFDAPHNTEQRVTFPDLEPVSYILNIYETTGYPTLGTLRFSDNIDPTFLGVNIKLSEYITMAGGGNDYTDASWVGWIVDSLERVPQGTQFVNIGYILHVGGDGFTLAQVGDVFAAGEQWVARFAPQIVTATPIYNSAKIINSSRIITADTTLTADDAAKAILMQGAGGSFTATLPLISSLDPFQLFIFQSAGGNHINASVAVSGSDIFNFNMLLGVAAATILHLGQSEELWIMNDPANGWIVLKSPDGMLKAGIIIDDYLMGLNSLTYTAHRVNSLFADGCNFAGSGALLDRNVYRRLWAAVQASGSAIAEGTAPGQWACTSTNPATSKPYNFKGFFSTGDTVNTFRTPLLYNAGFLRAISGGAGRLPGSFQDMDVAAHDHVMHGKGIISGSGSNFFLSNKATSYSGGGAHSFGAKINTPDTDVRTGTSDADSLVPSVETTPTNYGIYKSILI